MGLANAQSPSRSHVPVGAKCTNFEKGLNCNRVLFAAYTTIWLCTSLTLLNPASPVVRFLCDSGIDFVVVGDFAACLQGARATTGVVEICYSPATPNLQRLVSALAPFHPRPRGIPGNSPFDWSEATVRENDALLLVTELGYLDMAAEVAGIGSYVEVKERSVLIRVFERSVAILDLRSLIEVKRAAGREKDLLALPELESLRESEEP